MKSYSSPSTTTSSNVNRYLCAGVFASLGFVLSLVGGVWFVASAGMAGALLNGTAPMWVSLILALTTVLVFGSLGMAAKAFAKAGKETWSTVSFIAGIFIILAVGQLWHFAV